MCNKNPWNAVKCSKLEAVTREITIMVPLTSLAVTLRLNWSARQPQDQFNLELHFYTLAGTGKDIQSFIFLFISWKRKTILHDPDGVLELVKLYFSLTPPPSTDRCLQLELYLFDSLKQVADSNKSSRCSSQKRPKTFFSQFFSLQGEDNIESNHLKRLLKLKPKLRKVYVPEL